VLVSIEAASVFVLQEAFDLEDLLIGQCGYMGTMVTKLFGDRRFGFSSNCRTISCSAKAAFGCKTAAPII
jgi:hypothetical protein